MSAVRAVDDKTLLDKFIEEAAKVIEKHCKYIVVSGFVAIAHGRSRGTEDIDVIIERISRDKFGGLHKDFERAGFEAVQNCPADELYDHYLAENSSIRYVKRETFVPELELKLAKDRLDEEQLRNRRKIPLTGVNVYFSSIEASIAFKEDFLKSDKDMEDARYLRAVYAGELSEKEIDRIKALIRAFKK